MLFGPGLGHEDTGLVIITGGTANCKNFGGHLPCWRFAVALCVCFRFFFCFALEFADGCHSFVVVFVQRQKQPVNPDLKKKFQGIHSEKLFEEKLQKRREEVEQVTADCYILYLFVSRVLLYISEKRH